MKKLLVIGSTFPRWEGDTEPRFILDYAKAMTIYYDVTVLVPAAVGAEDEEILEGVKVKRFHYFPIHKFETLCYPGAIVPRIREKKSRALLVPWLLIAMYFSLRKECKMVDLVHAHWLIPQGIIQSFIKGTEYVVTGHGGDVTSLNFRPIKRLKKRCLKKAKAIVGVSDCVCEKMHEICSEVSPQKISMGCDLSKFTPKKRNVNYFEHVKKNIVFVGRLAEKKGVKYLIEAMREVDANLYIIGKGPLEAELKLQVEELNLNDKIAFWGAKTHEELPEILASADLFVAPSIIAEDGDQEGLPVSIMEAMASGTPVVAGISGGVKDIVHDGINGYVLDVKDIKGLVDRINRILNDDALASKFRHAALETIIDYSYEAIAEKYVELVGDMEK